MHTFPSSFLFPIIISNFKIYQLQSNNVLRTRKKIKTKPIFKITQDRKVLRTKRLSQLRSLELQLTWESIPDL